MQPQELGVGPIFDSVRDAVIVADAATGRIVLWNPAAEVVFGYSATEAIGLSLEALVPEQLKRQHRKGLARFRQTGHGPYIDAHSFLEVPALRKTGEPITVEMSLSPACAPAGGGRFAVAILRDVTERKRLERQAEERTQKLLEANLQLQQLAGTDVLTGVANRSRGEEMLAKYLSLARRHGRRLSFTYLDLDHFKHVNDRYGHVAGDTVLRRVGQLLACSFRGEDIIGRWGGEEFAVGMFGMAKTDAGPRVANLLAAFRRERFVGPENETFRVSFSAGVAEYPTDGDEVGELYRAADEALYRAKHRGRGRVVVAGEAEETVA
jgi:diguanylate cyclase (GGDEF)-like protein/PAS domain S-box-containing protein